MFVSGSASYAVVKHNILSKPPAINIELNKQKTQIP